jgi:ligand-binding sensor domain-containing protein
MSRFRWIFLFCSIGVRFASAQEYSYTHYDIAEGLAGSTAYCITQDADGFIWVGTETGVSRFDGTHFKNFTTADGLPDIEVIQIFGDSRGRVWMAPFRKSVCYYYKGSIHNPENDSVLRRLRFEGNVGGFAEDAAGDILLQEEAVLQVVTPLGSVIRFDSLDGEPIRSCWAISRSATGNFLAQVGQKIIEFSVKGVIRSFPISMFSFLPSYVALNPWQVIYFGKGRQYVVLSFSDNKRTILSTVPVVGHVNFSLVDDSLAFINSFTNSRQYDCRTLKREIFLPGKDVSRVFRDATGSLWFTTLSEGIFRLNSDELRSIRMTTKAGEPCAAYSISLIGHELWVGCNRNLYFRYSFPTPALATGGSPSVISRNRLLLIDTAGPETVVCCSDECVYISPLPLISSPWFVLHAGIKSAVSIDNHHWLIGTATGAFILDPGRHKITDTICRERTTVVYYSTDTAYFGTLNGLYRKTAGHAPEFLGEKTPFLRRPISCMTRSADGTLWIASYDDAGVIGYRNDKVIAMITQREGLTSNICQCLQINGGTLWIGTDKGLNRVEINKPGYPVSRYTVNDGLGSNMINTLFSAGRMVYVGTNAGLSFFDTSHTKNSEPCRLQLLAVLNSGKDRLEDTTGLVLPYQDKAVRFEYAGISYRSVGGVRYRYRLLGLDSNWRETGQTFLEYQTLPSGNYWFQLQAINKFDIRSGLITLPFVMATPFWQTAWFEILGVIVFLSLIWLVVNRRIRQIRSRQDQQDRLMREKAELENKALQAQMNPHFIFNCLNSIQQFIFDGDELAVNNCISGFARLIRATLHNSSRPFISVMDEIDYLSTYLSLEKMRFKDKMEYLIEVDPAIDQQNSLLPPMLIQPYVENCMRHGLRHKEGGKGYILITMRRREGRLMIIVEDNGIGRKKAIEYKSREHIEYQSKGMSMTADRIRIISAVYGGDISVKVDDILNEGGKPAGTRILISLPEFRHWTAEPA